MNQQTMADLTSWESGELSASELLLRHPGGEVAAVASVQQRLSGLMLLPAPPPEASWEVLKRRLPSRRPTLSARMRQWLQKPLALGLVGAAVTGSAAFASPELRDHAGTIWNALVPGSGYEQSHNDSTGPRSGNHGAASDGFREKPAGASQSDRTAWAGDGKQDEGTKTSSRFGSASGAGSSPPSVGATGTGETGTAGGTTPTTSSGPSGSDRSSSGDDSQPSQTAGTDQQDSGGDQQGPGGSTDPSSNQDGSDGSDQIGGSTQDVSVSGDATGDGSSQDTTGDRSSQGTSGDEGS